MMCFHSLWWSVLLECSLISLLLHPIQWSIYRINVYMVTSEKVRKWFQGTASACHFFLICHTLVSALTAHYCYLFLLLFLVLSEPQMWCLEGSRWWFVVMARWVSTSSHILAVFRKGYLYVTFAVCEYGMFSVCRWAKVAALPWKLWEPLCVLRRSTLSVLSKPGEISFFFCFFLSWLFQVLHKVHADQLFIISS